MFFYIVFNPTRMVTMVQGHRETMGEIIVEAEWHAKANPDCVFTFGNGVTSSELEMGLIEGFKNI